jgi:hypothetical protein
MQQMTEIDLRKMLTETKHVLTIADIALVVELDKAADVVVSGPVDKSESIYAFPLLCGGDAFRAPSIGKQIYWEEQVASELPEKWLTCAFLWLLTCPEVPDQRGGEIVKAVKKWGRKCKLSTDDIAKVIGTYSSEETQGGEKANYGEIVSLLVREYGQDCSHWLNAPEAEVNMLLADWTRRQEAKAASYRASKAGSKNPLPPLPSPKIKALQSYRKLKDKLRASWLVKE